MIWYVATLIASVISTRGLAAQGELKCSVPPPTLLVFLDLPSGIWLSNPGSEAPAPSRRTSGYWLEGWGAAGGRNSAGRCGSLWVLGTNVLESKCTWPTLGPMVHSRTSNLSFWEPLVF